MGGLRTKLRELELAVATCHYDIVIVETWLTDNIFSSELNPYGYIVYRNNRNIDNSTKQGWRCISCCAEGAEYYAGFCGNRVEEMFVSFKLGFLKIILGV